MRWRRHQREALDAIAIPDDDRHWVVLPPGGGKTLVGVGAAAGWEGKIVAFGPNLAIVAQWRAAWEAFTGEKATSDRELPTRFTALTYQTLAVFDSESDGTSAKTRLHPNGLALVERLHAAGPITLVLDECHHLLEVWGDLLDEILADLPEARIVALTATPPDLLTTTQAERVHRLFGTITYQAGIPALVAEGDLAPFAELAWFTRPTPREDEWLDARAVRAAELITELTSVDTHVPLLTWVQMWDFRDFSPEVGDAVVRLALAGHLDMPEHAHVFERHRQDVTLADWLTVADLWLEALATAEPEQRAFARRIGDLLPGVGYRLTKTGVKPGVPLVDRVLSRSASKSAAAAEIVAHTVGDDPDARVLVLTDFSTATALPADLDGVIEPQSGSARWLLEAMVADERIARARPVMVTGTSVGAEASVLRELLPDETITGEGVVVLEGTGASRWLAAATDALNRGWTRCLVGTRGLLGEGWDARAVSGVVDLTSATTSTAIVQTRGRSLRSDPLHPDKVAVNWTVTCVAPDRPQGDADYRRLVRKHAGWFAVDEEGDVVDGVAHLDSRLSPDVAPGDATVEQADAKAIAPPGAHPGSGADPLAELNARALRRAQDPEAIRTAWAEVDPGRLHPVSTLRVVGDRTPRTTVARREAPPPVPARSAGLAASGGALVALGIGIGLDSLPATLILLLVALVVGGGWWLFRARRVRRAVTTPPSTSDYARAVADALHADGQSPVGAEGVVVEITAGGETRIHLEGVDEEATEVFTQALTEVLGMIEQPRYLISRPVWDDTTVRLVDALRPPTPDREVWHQVPSTLATLRSRADLFAEAWTRHVGPGRAVFVGTPEGTGLLQALKWTSPFGSDAGLSVVTRRHW